MWYRKRTSEVGFVYNLEFICIIVCNFWVFFDFFLIKLIYLSIVLNRKSLLEV